jgi:hypothetical protein
VAYFGSFRPNNEEQQTADWTEKKTLYVGYFHVRITCNTK